MAAAAASRATFQRAGARVEPAPEPERISGSVRRSSEATASKEKRPLSHSQDQLTGSESTPLKRSTWSRLESMVIRHPTEQAVQVDSVVSRSHGRALNRYGLAVSAPTGQICTVLPEKYELNGSPGNVLTWVLAPRSMKWISGSSVTSEAKRVQRSQRMQRSRSISTVADSSIGFS